MVCVCVFLFYVEVRVFPRILGLEASEAEKPWSRCGTYDGQIRTAYHLAKLTQPDRVQVKWVPGHSGIKGNEEADKEAKMGCQAHLGFPLPPASIAATKRAAQRVHWRAFTQYWSQNAPKRYRDLRIGLEKRPPELHLP